ncbi:glycosyltransferase [Streptomyces lunaelactis]|uniref:glycosyltransferase n=1 Tax=Streptomyces lunaelactis TaxID=1535768 RepID=UPI001585AC2D|nr:glycosyltransferase [Streptomyces lunaelactis]NUK06438.1 glycosyltransferase [Streptomyces lunaelactis]NUK36292.1 glycosyltransferase [Streptomyces lunaelactis]NUK42816.1 glycosyltransferase [Streptomyces lunaelactis]NUK52354.1 glycosyltransferase [Streptomyces lunaelactis]NUK59077.1 glycosyltransferase [Streptomyces lunaelactis]
MGERPTLTGGSTPPGTGTQAPPGTSLTGQPRPWRATTRRWVIRAVLPTALALWLLSLRNVDLDRMRDLGLLQVLPVLFWVALALLTLGFCLALSDGRTRFGWFAAYVLGLIAVIHATPTLLYPTLRYSWAWKHLAIVDAMQRHGGEVPNADKLSIYNDWPGFFQLNALFLRATGIESAVGYAAWTPVFANALLLGPLLLMYRAVARDKRLIWGAVWIFYSCSWVGQDYFAPQAFAFLLFVTVIALILRQLPSSALPRPDRRRRGAWPPGLLLLVLVIVAAIVSSHPLTPLMLLSALLVLSLPRRNRRVVLPVLAGAIVLTIAWDMTVARSYIAPHLSSMVESLVQPDSNISSGLATLGTAAPGLALVSWIDRGLSAAVFLLAAIGFVRRPWTRHTGLPLLVLSPMPVLAANAYGGEMIFRAYLFALPAVAFLIAALLLREGTRPWRRMLTVYPVLLAMLGGLFFGYYGKEVVNRFTLQEVAAARYVTENAPPGSPIISLTSGVPGLDMHYEQHRRVLLAQQDVEDKQRLVRDPLETVKGFAYGASAKEPAYIILTRAQAQDLYLTGVLPADTMARLESALPGAEGFTRVYSNRDAVVYRYETPTDRRP